MLGDLYGLVLSSSDQLLCFDLDSSLGVLGMLVNLLEVDRLVHGPDLTQFLLLLFQLWAQDLFLVLPFHLFVQWLRNHLRVLDHERFVVLQALSMHLDPLFHSLLPGRRAQGLTLVVL